MIDKRRATSLMQIELSLTIEEGAPRLGVVLLAGVMLVLSSEPSFAAFDEECARSPFRGQVRTIIQAEGKLDRTTSKVIARRVRSETEISRDGKLATTVQYDADTPMQARLRMFPTTVAEFDSNGRMIRETLRLDGRTTFTTTSCHYDAEGRLARVTMKSKNPEFNRTLTYAYGPSWRSQRFLTAVASVLTTITMDDSGRPLKEVEYDELHSFERLRSEYRYIGDHTERCSVDAAGRLCSESVSDGHGNEVVMRMDAGTRTEKYDYDSKGNWVKRATVWNAAGSSAARYEEVIWRTITYW